jgi:hypothetical protein
MITTDITQYIIIEQVRNVQKESEEKKKTRKRTSGCGW